MNGNSSRLGRTLLIVVGGFAFFLAAVLLATGTAYWNADVTPTVPWFPLLVLPVLFGAVLWIDRRWDIGLRVPPRTRWGLLAAFAVTSMIAAHCVLIFEGAVHGIVREFEKPPPGVSSGFAWVYWIGILLAMSTASEVAFRGIMQGRLTPLLGMWPALLIPLVVNLLSHRWEGLFERAAGVTFVLFAWGWLRHISGSLTPTILTHIATILVWDSFLLLVGPLDARTMSGAALAATGVLGVVTFGASILISQRIVRARALFA